MDIKQIHVHLFKDEYPTLPSYFRSIILFGKNSASYKFALAKSLIEKAKEPNTFISLEELAIPFSHHIVEHLKINKRQATSKSSKFLDACKQFIHNEISYDQLIDATRKYGFNVVLNAFHNVDRHEIPIKFFETVKEGRKKGIILTDEIFKIMETANAENFSYEVEARWRLVETAWQLNLATSLLIVKYDPELKTFFVEESKIRRVDVTPSRDALNGYQKGKCFYCFRDISVEPGSADLAEVDHFIPHSLHT